MERWSGERREEGRKPWLGEQQVCVAPPRLDGQSAGDEGRPALRGRGMYSLTGRCEARMLLGGGGGGLRTEG